MGGLGFLLHTLPHCPSFRSTRFRVLIAKNESRAGVRKAMHRRDFVTPFGGAAPLGNRPLLAKSLKLGNVDILFDHDRAFQALAGTNARAEPHSVARRSASATICHHSPRGKPPRLHGNLEPYGCPVLDCELLGDVAKPRRHARARGVGHCSANCSYHAWQTLISAHSLA